MQMFAFMHLNFFMENLDLASFYYVYDLNGSFNFQSILIALHKHIQK